jgi:cytochrome c peroxidase
MMWLKKRHPRGVNRVALGLLACKIIPSELAFSEVNKDAQVSIWTVQEKQQLLSMSAHHLPKVGEDLSNQYQNNQRAVALGAKLFFDTRLSESGTIACSVCHQPNREFSDGLRVASGLEQGKRNTPSLIGVSHQKWFFWDGRKDSLWAQALEPFEDATEHNLSRTKLLKIIFEDPDYRDLYTSVFKETPSKTELSIWPENASPKRDLEGLKVWKSLEKNTRKKINRAFSNIGKAIAAYEATLLFKKSRFDQYLDDLRNDKSSSHLNESEVAGLKVFIGSGKCMTCHSSALLSNQHFQNIGTGIRGKDMGRSAVAENQSWDVFNCLGEFSDAPKSFCSDLKYMKKDRHALSGSFKVPSLRNVSKTAPYLHDGRFKSIEQVIDFYLDPPSKRRSGNHLPTIVLTDTEKSHLIDFLQTL